MDRAAALKAIADLQVFVEALPTEQPSPAPEPLPTPAPSGTEAINPPAAPRITSAKVAGDSSGQIQFINSTTPSPIRNKHYGLAMDALRFTAPRDAPMVIEDILVDKCSRLIQQDGTSPTGVSNVTVRRVASPGCGRRGIYIRLDSHNWLVEDALLRSESVSTSSGNLPMGVQIKETAHDIVLRRVVCENWKSSWGSHDYWNADGFVTERGNYNILMEDCVARFCTDGGFDLKSTNTRLHRCLAEGNARNYRLWSSNQHGQLTSIAPRKISGQGGGENHIRLYEGCRELVIDRLIVRDTKPNPIFFSEAAHSTRIVVKSHDIQVPAGTVLAAHALPDSGYKVTVVDGNGNALRLG